MSMQQQIQELQHLLHQSELKNKSLDIINQSLNDALDKNQKQNIEQIKRIKNQYGKDIANLRDIYKQELVNLKNLLLNEEKENQLLREKNRILRKSVEIQEDKNQFIFDNQEKQREVQIKQSGFNLINYRQALIKSTQQEQIISNLQSTIDSLQNHLKNSQNSLKSIQKSLFLANKERDSAQTQLKYYKSENQMLLHEQKELKNKMNTIEEEKEQIIENQNSKWWKINQNLLIKVQKMEKSIKLTEQRENKFYKEIQKLKENCEKQKNKAKQSAMQLNWYKQLLNEAKGQFVSSELHKQNLSHRLNNEKNQLVRQTKRLKQQMSAIKQKKQTPTSHKISHKSTRSSHSYLRSQANKSTLSLLEGESGLQFKRTPEKGRKSTGMRI